MGSFYSTYDASYLPTNRLGTFCSYKSDLMPAINLQQRERDPNKIMASICDHCVVQTKLLIEMLSSVTRVGEISPL